MSKSTLVPARNAIHGTGRAKLVGFGTTASFAELSYTYPLKLLSPRQTTATNIERLAILYNLSYGGGLIGGDQLALTLELGSDVKLLFLTQGSTKIFPSRARPRLATGRAEVGDTRQRLSATIGSGACLVMLPDPVTPFSHSSYSQVQIFRLAAPTKDTAGGSIVLLDWFTSGRMSRGEEWQFDRYRSANEIWIGNERVASDVLLLEQPPSSSSVDETAKKINRLRDSLAPYACYATLLLFGPATHALSKEFAQRYDGLSQMQRKVPEDLIWSYSPLEYKTSINNGKRNSGQKETGVGAIVRVAAKDTESVRQWLRESLRAGLEAQIGDRKSVV